MISPTFEIKVVWTSALEGYVNGLRFYISNTVILFRSGFKSGKKKSFDRLNQFRRAITATPEYEEAKRECKAEDMIVHQGKNPDCYHVLNPLNGKLYDVVMHGEGFCSCPDHTYRETRCKHIRAVENHLKFNSAPTLLPSFAGRSIRMGGRSGLKVVSESSVELTPTEAKASIGL